MGHYRNDPRINHWVHRRMDAEAVSVLKAGNHTEVPSAYKADLVSMKQTFGFQVIRDIIPVNHDRFGAE